MIVNKRFWDSLPADVRSALERAIKETTAYEREIAQKINDDALTLVRAAGSTEVYVLTPEERAAWAKAFEKVYKDFEGRIGPELIRDLRASAS